MLAVTNLGQSWVAVVAAVHTVPTARPCTDDMPIAKPRTSDMLAVTNLGQSWVAVVAAVQL
jgi:hypothetical protein